MKKILSLCIVGILLISGITVVAHPMETNANEEKKWTWIFYDDADFFNAFDPLTMGTSIYPTFPEEVCSGENLNVLVLQDGEKDPASLWYINNQHETELIKDMGEINMGDYQTLYDFITYAKDQYPAERYLLSMYDHGGGWAGACIDDTDNDMLTMDEIQKGIANAGGIDILCFTAPCLMGSLEAVYELKDCVDVYIGSEALSGYGIWYGTIQAISEELEQHYSKENHEIGQFIIDSITEKSLDLDLTTMTAIRTDKMPHLVSTINQLCTKLIDNKDLLKEDVIAQVKTLETFQTGIIDFYEFLTICEDVTDDQSIRDIIDDVKNAYEEVLIAEIHGDEYSFSNGLSIYFPLDKTSYNTNYADAGYDLDFSKDTQWDEFLFTYANVKSKHALTEFFEMLLETFPILSYLKTKHSLLKNLEISDLSFFFLKSDYEQSKSFTRNFITEIIIVKLLIVIDNIL